MRCGCDARYGLPKTRAELYAFLVEYEFQLRAPTPTTDRECSAKDACSVAFEFETFAGNATANR